jgi:hypothetical protein
VRITLQTHAFKSAPGTEIRIRLPEGAEVLEGSTHAVVDLEAEQTHDLTVVARLTKPGEQTIEGRAFRAVSEYEAWGDSDALFLTVEEKGGFVGHRSGDDPELEAVRVSDKLAGEPQQIPAADATAEGGGQPLAIPGGDKVEPDPGNEVELVVCWELPDRNGNATPFRDARVRFIDDDAGGSDVLASGFTDYYTGCASARVMNGDRDEGGEIDVYASLRMENPGHYRVENQAGVVFSCATTTQPDVSGDLNLGTQQCGGPSGNDRAAWIYDDVYRLRRFVEEHRAGKGDPPGDCTVQWQTDSTVQTGYYWSDVRLAGADAGSRDIVVHECAHRYMHTAYGGWTSVWDHPANGQHFIEKVCAPACAWSEGWTYVLVAGADGNPTFTWPNGAFRNLETANCTTPTWWDKGPAVEGRVGAALIDLIDPFTLSFDQVTGFTNEPFNANCFGVDDESGLFSAFWEVFTSQNDDVFVAQGNLTDSFSKAWQAAGHTPGPSLGAGPGTAYQGADGNFYWCPAGGQCVGGLNTIPTFGSD